MLLENGMPALLTKDLETLSGSRLFQSVDLESIQHLLEECKVKHVKRGKKLVAEGEISVATTYVILEGRLSVHLEGPHSSPHAIVGPGECVGEMSVLDGKPRSADVLSDEDARVLEIPEAMLWSMVHTSHAFSRNMLRILSIRMRRDNAALVSSYERQRELEQAASTDGLTGLRNRRWINEAFPRQLARCAREAREVSMLLVDLDNLKACNEKGGHIMGDAMICRTASVLLRHLRPQDLVARFGGDEFCVLLPATPAPAAQHVADRLRAAVEAEVCIDLGKGPMRGTISCGVATGEATVSLETLLDQASAALHRAKHAGKNCISK